MKKCYYFDGGEIIGIEIDDIPPSGAMITIGGFLYVVVRYEFDYDKNEIRVIIIQSDELGIIKN
jgi:hypothetical protein